MKKYLFCLVIILTLSIAILPVKGYARWVLIDDFEYTGDPDLNIWEIGYSSTACENDPSASIYVNGSEAVFTHDPSKPGCSTWLRIKDISGAKAVRATVRLEGSCYGDVRGRIGADIGEDVDGNYVFQNIAVRYNNTITTNTSSYSPVSPFGMEYRIFASTFGYWPINLSEDFTIEMNLNRTILKFSANSPSTDFGKTSFTTPQRIFKYDGFWAGIGTRNDADVYSGSCFIYFDDVYVDY